MVVNERKASLVSHCGVDAGRSHGHSLGNATLLSVLMPGHVATHTPSLATEAQQGQPAQISAVPRLRTSERNRTDCLNDLEKRD